VEQDTLGPNFTNISGYKISVPSRLISSVVKRTVYNAIYGQRSILKMKFTE